jgi:hypothetical protein
MKTTTKCFLTSALALGMAATTQALTFFRPVANGNWDAPATWDQNAVPNDSTKYPVIQDGRTVTLDASMGNYTIYDFIVGYNSGTSTLNISGGGITTAQGDEFMVGGNSPGIINQTGGTITVPVGNVQFCAPWGNAAGTWNLSGGTMNVANSIIHNKPTANVATVQLTGGTMTFGTWGDGMPNLVNDGTTISPGLTGTARTSNVNMNFTQHSGTLQLDIGDGGSDFIRMHNSVYGGTVVADLSGTLELNALGAITQGVWFNVLETDGGAITDNLSLADPVNWVKRVSGNVLQVKFTGTPDSTPPVVVTVSPADNATDVPLDTNLGITFNESVVPGSGNIEILDSNYNLIESIDVTSGAVSFADALVAINPVGNLGNSTGYFVQIPTGVIKDLAGNDFAGIGDKTVWNFTSAAPQAQIVFTQQGFHAATDLSTAGTLIAAVNLGTTTAATLNGITFTGNNTGSVTAGGVAISFFGSDFLTTSSASGYNGTTVTGVDADNLLDTWAYSYHPGQGDGSVDFSGLTIGQTYEVQLLLSDDRSFAAGRTINVVSGNNPKVPGPGEINQADFTSRSDSSALLVTGSFTATTNTQSLFIQLVGFPADAGHLNALQLRAILPPGDTTPPVVVSSSPADDLVGVFPKTNLVMTFDESVMAGSGNILIKDAGDNVIESLDVTSAAVSLAGAVVTINPPGYLGNSTGYYVEIPAGVIKDLAGNDFAGITGKTAWNFTTAGPQAAITFTQQGFDAATDLSTAGALIAAVNLGTTTAATLNGITFTGNNTGSMTAGGVKINFFGSDFIPYGEGSLYNGTTVTGVDADNLLDTWGYAYHPGQADGSVDLIGLTVGRTYKVQLLLSDDRGFASGRTIDVVSGYNPKVPGPGEIIQADFTSRSDSSALLVTGTFTATTNTQSLFITTTGLTQDAGPLAALQLRDVTGVATPYENWASSNGIPGEASTADHDNDGLSNGTEYALGLSPTQPNGAPGTLTGNVISFTKGAEAIANGDVTYIIEESDDLGSWSAVVTQTPPNTDPAISYTLPTGKPKEFVRLKVIIE